MVTDIFDYSKNRASAGRRVTRIPLFSLHASEDGGDDWSNHRQYNSSENRDLTFEPKDVLVVEDEAYLCDLVADVLEAEGHQTRTASNGLEALSQVERRKPDIILLDLMMPIMDGWEVMRVLHKRPEWASIPVVIVTAIYDVKRIQEETGAVAVVTKPFDIDQISEVVERFG